MKEESPVVRFMRLLPAMGCSGLIGAACIGTHAENVAPTPPPTPAEAASSADNPGAVTMEAFNVRQKVLTSFGLALAVWKDGNTGKVSAIYVSAVKPGSPAEAAGLGPRTRIEAIDGKPVTEMDATYRPGGDLHRAFINRRIGDKVTLLVRTEGQPEPRLVTLEEAPTGWIDPVSWMKMVLG